MLFRLSISAIKDFVSLLKEDNNFFQKSEAQKKDLVLRKFSKNFPLSLTEYLININAESFINDLRNTVSFLKNEASIKDNKFIDAISKFISIDFAYVLDKLDTNFFFKKIELRKEFLDQFLAGQSYFLAEFEDLILYSTYQELNDMAESVLANLKESELIIIESAAPIDSESKTKIRNYFIKDNEYSFAEFRINKRIIGGIRVFVNGTLADLSWMGKLQGLHKLKT